MSILPAVFWASNATSDLQPLIGFHLGHLPKSLKADTSFGEMGGRCFERPLSSLIAFPLQSESGSANASIKLKKILLRN